MTVNPGDDVAAIARRIGAIALEDGRLEVKDSAVTAMIVLDRMRQRLDAPASPADAVDTRALPGLLRDERMSQLAESFPTLRGRPGVRPWNVSTVLEQLRQPWPCAGARHALHFVLAVWSPSMVLDEPIDAGESFDVVRALTTWDAVHRAAFASWAAHPWWA